MPRPHESTSVGPHSGSAAPKVELEIVRGRARNKRRPVAGKAYLIGTAEDCDLVLGDPQFPQVVAYVLRGPHGVTIRWLGAGPELTINGQLAAESISVADQDLIRTGPYEFRFHIDGPPRRTTDSSHGSRTIPAPHARPRVFAGRVAAPSVCAQGPSTLQPSLALRLLGMHPHGKAAS